MIRINLPDPDPEWDKMIAEWHNKIQDEFDNYLINSLKDNNMKIYRWHWHEEGILWRRGDWTILKPKGNIHIWRVRKVHSKPGGLEPGEGDYGTEREAFRAANRTIRRG